MPETINLSDVCNEFITERISYAKLTDLRAEILKIANVGSGKIETFDDNIINMFDSYDILMFKGKIKNAIQSGMMNVNIGWSESENPGDLDVSEDNKIFTLELSRKIFGNLTDGAHTVFGVLCATPMQCIQIYIESFIATILYETCGVGQDPEKLADILFFHSSGGVNFAPPSENDVEEKIRERLLDLSKDFSKDVKVTIKGIGEFTLSSARNLEKLTLRDTPEGIDRFQSYLNVSHINGIPI